jgi:hypothetical protein
MEYLPKQMSMNKIAMKEDSPSSLCPSNSISSSSPVNSHDEVVALDGNSFFQLFFLERNSELTNQIYEFLNYFESPFTTMGITLFTFFFFGIPYFIVLILDATHESDTEEDSMTEQAPQSGDGKVETDSNQSVHFKMSIDVLLLINSLVILVVGVWINRVHRPQTASLQQIKSTTTTWRPEDQHASFEQPYYSPENHSDKNPKEEKSAVEDSSNEIDLEQGQGQQCADHSLEQILDETQIQRISIFHKACIQSLIFLVAIRKSYDGDICSLHDDQAFHILRFYFCESGVMHHPLAHMSQGLDSDIFLLLFIYPLAQTVLFPGVSVVLTMVQSILSLLTYLSLLLTHGEYPSISLLILWFLVAIVFPLMQHYRNACLFFMAKKLRKMSESDAQTQQEHHLDEMRFVIANVAHDLKTVSSQCIQCFPLLLIFTFFVTFSIAIDLIHFRS